LYFRPRHTKPLLKIASSPSSETLPQCHPEAVAEGSAFRTKLASLDSSPEFTLSVAEGAQNGIRLFWYCGIVSLEA
jgi:hypothetical protein